MSQCFLMLWQEAFERGESLANVSAAREKKKRKKRKKTKTRSTGEE